MVGGPDQAVMRPGSFSARAVAGAAVPVGRQGLHPGHLTLPLVGRGAVPRLTHPRRRPGRSTRLSTRRCRMLATTIRLLRARLGGLASSTRHGSAAAEGEPATGRVRAGPGASMPGCAARVARVRRRSPPLDGSGGVWRLRARRLPLPGRPPSGRSGQPVPGLGADPKAFIWCFGWWPYAILHGQNPFVTHAIWAPSGVNLIWTTSVPGLALLFAPLTLIAGPVRLLQHRRRAPAGVRRLDGVRALPPPDRIALARDRRRLPVRLLELRPRRRRRGTRTCRRSSSSRWSRSSAVRYIAGELGGRGAGAAPGAAARARVPDLDRGHLHARPRDRARASGWRSPCSRSRRRRLGRAARPPGGRVRVRGALLTAPFVYYAIERLPVAAPSTRRATTSDRSLNFVVPTIARARLARLGGLDRGPLPRQRRRARRLPRPPGAPDRRAVRLAQARGLAGRALPAGGARRSPSSARSGSSSRSTATGRLAPLVAGRATGRCSTTCSPNGSRCTSRSLGR